MGHERLPGVCGSNAVSVGYGRVAVQAQGSARGRGAAPATLWLCHPPARQHTTATTVPGPRPALHVTAQLTNCDSHAPRPYFLRQSLFHASTLMSDSHTMTCLHYCATASRPP